CYESVHRYRNRLLSYRPGHVWGELNDEELLHKLGAVGRAEDGTLHPTAAGLLMFGNRQENKRPYEKHFRKQESLNSMVSPIREASVAMTLTIPVSLNRKIENYENASEPRVVRRHHFLWSMSLAG
ncbi:MAG: hypothetical protein IJ072_00390, partial [Oscillospiraceae bacterium]|nr:hypothetical protein [Oscillospiraceae bacterium]